MHPNMIGHICGVLSLVRLFPIVSSKKHQMDTPSSTETKIVAVDYFMPTILCTIYWLDAQVYDVFDNIFFQYNKSSILLGINGKDSISKFMKHINIIYYFVTDCIEKMNSQ